MTTTTTDTTCTSACWMAKEAECRCSCGGANHGRLKTGSGTQPQRTAQIQGVMYRLRAVGTHRGVYEELHKAREHIRNTEEKTATNYGFASWDTLSNRENARFWLRSATQGQLASWPELSAARAWNGQGPRPSHMLWERVTLKEQAPA